MPTILWIEGVPSNASTVGSTPDYLRSVWTAIAVGLGTDLYWPGSGGGSQASIGELRPGASRTFMGIQSGSSSAASFQARAYLASDTSRLFAYQSNSSYLAGTPYLLEHATFTQNAVWVKQSGTTFVPSTGTPSTATITFPTPYASGPNFVMQTLSERSFTLAWGSLSTTGFVSLFSYVGPGAQSGVTVHWRTIGRMTGAV